jgi:hypothetical protein
MQQLQPHMLEPLEHYAHVEARAAEFLKPNELALNFTKLQALVLQEDSIEAQFQST